MNQQLEEMPFLFKDEWWIGCQEPKTLPGGGEACYFRLPFRLSAVPEEGAGLCITSAGRFRLYVNGQPVICGPCKGDRWNHYVTEVELAPYLRTGDNVIAVHVVCWPSRDELRGVPGPVSVIPARTGAALLAVGAIGEVELSTAKAPWQAKADEADAWEGAGAYDDEHTVIPYVIATQRVRTGYLPEGWSLPGELGWKTAKRRWRVGMQPGGELVPLPLKMAPIPPMAEQRRAFARQMPNRPDDLPAIALSEGKVEANRHAALHLDAGALTTAYLPIRVEGGAGAVITVTYAERYMPDDPEGRMRDDWAHGRIPGGQQEIYELDGRSHVLENFWFRTFRYVRIEIQTAEQPLRFGIEGYRETAYPLAVRARMELPEPLDALWQASLRTLRLCMHETHEDCPYYEQLQYSLDTRLQLLFTYAVSGDTRMARRVLWDFHCSQLPDGILQSRYPCDLPQIIPSFSLYFIFMLEEYYLQTGDEAILSRYRPTIDAVLDYFDRHIGALGLVEYLGYWDYCDWVTEWGKNFGVPNAALTGPCTCHNLVYVQALQAAARMVELTGRPDVAGEYSRRAQQIQDRLMEHCYDKSRGLLREGPELEEFCQHDQALAVLTGMVTGLDARRMMVRTLEEPMLQCTYPWMFTLCRALEKAGLYDKTMALWTPYLKAMEYHMTTLPETPEPTRSDCHAWSSLPLYEFTRCWLGVRAGAPGWRTIEVTPQGCGLPSLSGTVPTPQGDVRVAWQVKDGVWSLRASAPAVPVQVRLPDGTEGFFPRGGEIILP